MQRHPKLLIKIHFDEGLEVAPRDNYSRNWKIEIASVKVGGMEKYVYELT